MSSKICFEDSIDDKATVIISISFVNYALYDVNSLISDFIEELRGYFS